MAELTQLVNLGSAGAVIALLFGYFPALRVKFAGLSSEWKSGVMIGMLVVTAFAVWGAGCIGWLDSGVACTKDSIPGLLKLIVIAIIANQSVNRIAPETNDVKDAKIQRVIDKGGTVLLFPEQVQASDMSAEDCEKRLDTL